MIKIAVIDDDPVEIILLKGFSEEARQPMEWHEFTRIEDFADRADAKDFHIVFLDRKIPPFVRFMDTVPIIEATGFNGRIILLSSHSDEVAPSSDICEIIGPLDKLAVQAPEAMVPLLSIQA